MLRAMNADVASRIAEQHSSKPGWWVEAARLEAARLDGHLGKRGQVKPYSQMDVAMAIGRDRNTIWRWENEGIDYFSWMGLMAVLGLPLEWAPSSRPPSAAPPKRKPSTSKGRPH